MKTDVKIGIALGIIIVVAGILWFMDRTEPTDEPLVNIPPPVEEPFEETEQPPVTSALPQQQSPAPAVITPPPTEEKRGKTADIDLFIGVDGRPGCPLRWASRPFSSPTNREKPIKLKQYEGSYMDA